MDKKKKKTEKLLPFLIVGILSVVLCFAILLWDRKSDPEMQEEDRSAPAIQEISESTALEQEQNSLKELEGKIDQYLTENEIPKADIGLYVEDLGSGQTISINGDLPFFAASTYKLPLAMVWYDQINAGNAQLSDYYDALENMIVNSDNDTAEYLFESLGGWEAYKQQIAAYDPEQEVNSEYLSTDNVFTPDNMGHILRYLYDHKEAYDQLIKDMKKSQPGQFLDRNLNIYFAQKYGSYQDAYNAIGLSLTSKQPYSIAIYTDLGEYGEEVIGDLNEICFEYFNNKAEK